MADIEHRLLPDEPVVDVQDYLERGGGEGLLAALEMDPDEVIDRVEAAGLRGRGGAGFPTGVKWRSVKRNAAESGTPLYLVMNGAEGEPGTYKDRTLFRYNPFQIIEGLLIALHATGAEAGYVCLKRRFDVELDRAARAIGALANEGWEGADRIELVTGPDDYLFGEEKAMLEVIEGKLAMPRILPPFEIGLFATINEPNPTVVNNVESYANVPLIIANGPEWFREAGTESSPGTMLFTVVGDVDTPGVYELPLGTLLSTLLDIAGAEDVKAIFSGTSNAVITPDLLDTPLGFDEFDERDIGMGSGGFIVYDSSHCIVRVVATLSEFLAIESCGQCNACKLGTQAITETLHKIDRGDGVQEDLDALLERCATVTDQNRCYLPVGEQLTVGSALHRFAEEFAAHLGAECPSERQPPIPKIASIDLDTGTVEWAPEEEPQHSYADA
ncbi:MAG: SLBB domain-containing protein [Actinobacteria bacterium]|nr:SLBB domain-containing protein [Actinomycetota bacterium]